MKSLPRAPAPEPAPLRVDVVAPGVVRTELWREMDDEHRDGLFEPVAGSLPVDRIGEPEDIAETYLYLMRGGRTTGSPVVVDGGTVLVRPLRRPRRPPGVKPTSSAPPETHLSRPVRNAPQSLAPKRISPAVTTEPSRGKFSLTDAWCSAAVSALMASSTKTSS